VGGCDGSVEAFACRYTRARCLYDRRRVVPSVQVGHAPTAGWAHGASGAGCGWSGCTVCGERTQRVTPRQHGACVSSLPSTINASSTHTDGSYRHDPVAGPHGHRHHSAQQVCPMACTALARGGGICGPWMLLASAVGLLGACGSRATWTQITTTSPALSRRRGRPPPPGERVELAANWRMRHGRAPSRAVRTRPGTRQRDSQGTAGSRRRQMSPERSSDASTRMPFCSAGAAVGRCEGGIRDDSESSTLPRVGAGMRPSRHPQRRPRPLEPSAKAVAGRGG
jgi:hypothetical protein